METFISAKNYYDVFMNACLYLVIFTIFHSIVLRLDDPKNKQFIQFTGYTLLIVTILYIGLRPISHLFGDTINYYRSYIAYEYGANISEKVGDYGWHVFMKTAAQFMPIQAFFTICAFIYVFPLYRISKEFFKEYWYYSFLLFVVSFSFWTYGVNGVRNGAAASLFLWGVSYHRKKIIMAICFLLAIQFHKTLLLPIIAFSATFLYNNPKTYFKGWFACIPLSLVMGGVWITIFASLGFGDERLAGYLTAEADAGTFKSTGFRWDFLFYSAFAVFAGWYFIIKRKFKDQVYFQLFNTYLICNGFWILVIRANYSNRFAYLSWFMMAIIIIYPMLKQQFFKNQHLMIGKIVLAYFAFTYLMYKVYYP
ncbi:EpsG-like putative glucosyltransferase [Cellulophaga sp. RHA19]|uniref:EpsG family protein n=1 Tax=Cellulophaga sp. RHA19 TaxID=1798237 RepID=UPI000C2C98AA|nr:EpsG family protein [Cellulophaga sp. RHA19]PKB44656.1 EpsG-like putative glucosyltransferase [Cellulophaga sp. RHA19]